MQPPRHILCAQSTLVLPDELIVEILSLLPVKSLLRYRCVCKSWKSLISDPHFVKLHLHRSPKIAYLILTLGDIFNKSNVCAVSCSKRSLLHNSSSTISEDGCYPLKDKYWPVGSCNGLVCLRKSVVTNASIEYWVRLWNPATRLRSKKSPCLHVNSRSCLARFGFGYDNSSDTYKVVALLLDSNSKKTEVKVHSMGDNCWRKIFSCPAFPLLGNNDGQFLSGTVNWLAFDHNSNFGYRWDAVNFNQLVIFSLDLVKETYKQLLLPEGLDEVPYPYNVPKLRVLRDCLCFIHDYKRSDFIVWQMKEFGIQKSWTQLVKLSYLQLQIGSFSFYPLLPVCISEKGDVVMLANNGDLEAFLYNCRDNTAKRIEIPNNKVWMDARDYVQSLVLPCLN